MQCAVFFYVSGMRKGLHGTPVLKENGTQFKNKISFSVKSLFVRTDIFL